MRDTYTYVYMCIYIYIYARCRCPRRLQWQVSTTPNPPTYFGDFRGLDSSIILNLRGGIPRPIEDFPEGLSQAMLVGIMLVGRLGVSSVAGVREVCNGQFPLPDCRATACVKGPFVSQAPVSSIVMQSLLIQQLLHVSPPTSTMYQSITCAVLPCDMLTKSAETLVMVIIPFPNTKENKQGLL